MAQLSASLLVRLIDGISGPAKAAASSIRGIGAAVANLNGRSASVTIGRQIAQQTRTIANAANRASTAVAAPTALAGGWAFNQAFQFEKTMNTMEALGELTQAQRTDAEKYLQVLNNKYPQTLTKLGQTMNELLRGGLSFKAAMGAMDSTMALAVFGDIDPKDASEIAVNALNQFRMPMATVEEAGASMKRVADVIAYAANKSNTDVRNMGLTFKYAAPMATALGMSLEQTAAMAMIMANAGIKGSESGVAMRSAMVRMLRPTKEMMATLARLGINLDDFKTKGKAITSNDVVNSLQADGIDATKVKAQIQRALDDRELRAAPQRMVAELSKIISEGLGSSSLVDKEALAKNLTDTLTAAGSQIDMIGFMKAVADKAGPEAANVIARIFDARQGSRLLTLAGADINKILDDIFKGSAGYADKGAQTMLKGIVGSFYKLTAAFESLAVSIAQSGVFKDLAGVFKSLADSIDSLGKSNPALLRFGTYALAALAVVGPLGLALSGAAAGFTMVAAAAKLAALVALAPFAKMGALAVAAAGGLRAAMAGVALATASATAAFRAFLLAAMLSPLTAARGVLAALGGALLALLNPLRLVRFAALAMRAALLFSPIGIALAGIAAAGTFIYNNWKGIGLAFEAFKGAFDRAITPIKPALEPIGNVISWLVDKVSALLGPVNEAGDGWVRFGIAVGKAVGDALVSLVNLVTEVVALPGKVITALTSAAEALYQAGMQMIQRLWDGMVAKFNELLEWVKSIPSKIRAAIGSIDLSGLIKMPSFSFGGGGVDGKRAGGGPVTSGKTYLVGEKGPELFTPSGSGRIVPNDELSGAGRRASGTASSRGGGSSSISVTFGNIVVQGVQSASEIAEQVGEQLEAKIREVTRGLQADLGYTS